MSGAAATSRELRPRSRAQSHASLVLKLCSRAHAERLDPTLQKPPLTTAQSHARTAGAHLHHIDGRQCHGGGTAAFHIVQTHRANDSHARWRWAQ